MESFDTEEKRKALREAVNALSHYDIPPSQLKSDGEVPFNQGGFGVVSKAWLLGPESVQSNAPVAVKTLIAKVEDPFRLALRFVREVGIWSRLDHPNVLKFLGFHFDLDNLSIAYIVSPYLQTGNIRGYLSKNDVPFHLRFDWILAITEGLLYLHTLMPPVIHGDLKADNVLLDDEVQPVLCDFGLSIVAEDAGQTGLTTSDGFKGSIGWCSPEIFNGERRTPASDIWAWAFVVLEIMTQKIPFWNEKNDFAAMMRVAQGRGPTEAEYPTFAYAAHFWSILLPCFAKNPASRPGVSIFRNELKQMTVSEISEDSSGPAPTPVSKPRMAKLSSLPDLLQGVGKLTPLWRIDRKLDTDKGVFLSPRGSFMAVVHRDVFACAIEMYDLVEGVQLWSHVVNETEESVDNLVAFNSDETTIAFYGRVNLHVVPMDDPSEAVKHLRVTSCRGIAFSGSELVVWHDKIAEKWSNFTSLSAPERTTIIDLQIYQDFVKSTIFNLVPSPDGGHVLFSLYDGSVRIHHVVVWDTRRLVSASWVDVATQPTFHTSSIYPYYQWLSSSLVLVGDSQTTTIYDASGEPGGSRLWTLNHAKIQLSPTSGAGPARWLFFRPQRSLECFFAEDILQAVKDKPNGGELQCTPRAEVHGTSLWIWSVRTAQRTIAFQHGMHHTHYIVKLSDPLEGP